MKNKTTKLALAGASVMCVLSALTSCEKVSQQDISPLPYTANSAGYRIFNGVDACARSGGNCLGEVIVIGHPQNRVALNTSFAGMTGKPSAVKAFFTGTSWKEQFPSLNTPDAQPFLERLQSGDCDIKRIELGKKVFYYAGAGELSATKNEVVLPVVYAD